MGYLILLILLFFLLLLVIGSIYQSKASKRDEEKYPPPGVLVKISRGHLHLYCQGHGDITVILEAGQGDSSLDWREVQSAVSKFTQVCAYDRPGLGWSSPAVKVLTSQQIAENLHQALENANIAGPCVLVGHSIGGVYTRAFAQLYPEKVAGLVFVDSAHENQRNRLPPDAMKELTMIKLLATVLNLLTPVGISRALKLADRMQGANFPKDIRPAAVARMNQSHFPKALFNEVKAVEINTTQIDPPADLGDRPLIVLTRGGNNPGLPDEQFEQLKHSWNELQQELARLSTNGQHILAEKSGHYIHHDQPALVVEVIRKVVDTLSNSRRN